MNHANPSWIIDIIDRLHTIRDELEHHAVAEPRNRALVGALVGVGAAIAKLAPLATVARKARR